MVNIDTLYFILSHNHILNASTFNCVDVNIRSEWLIITLAWSDPHQYNHIRINFTL